MWYKHFINHEKFYVCDLDLKVNEEVGRGGGGEGWNSVKFYTNI